MASNPVIWFEIYVQDVARAAASGGHIERPKFSIGDYGFISFVRDTAGNVIGLRSLK